MADAMLRALFTNLIGGGGAVSGLSYDTLPDNDDITITSGSADALGTYVEVESTVGAADAWQVGCQNSALAVAIDSKVLIATGAASSENVIAQIPFTRTDVSAVGATEGQVVMWPMMVRCPGGTRISAAAKDGDSARAQNVVTIQCTGLAG